MAAPGRNREYCVIVGNASRKFSNTDFLPWFLRRIPRTRLDHANMPLPLQIHCNSQLPQSQLDGPVLHNNPPLLH